MEINTLNVPQTSTALALPSSENSAVLSSDFETFLQMLTAQAKYQDPLEPIDSSAYAAQLAQFSMVEQQVQSNELLANLAEQLGGSNMAGMANWIGMEARTTEPAFFEGSPIGIGCFGVGARVNGGAGRIGSSLQRGLHELLHGRRAGGGAHGPWAVWA